MNIKHLLKNKPKEFINLINNALGCRLRILSRDQDNLQIFWVGILEAVKNVDNKRDPIPYLISMGWGCVKNNKKSEHSRNLIKYCPECGNTYGFRRVKKCDCGYEKEMPILSRHIELKDKYKSSPDNLIDRILFEQFVNTLSGKLYHVAKRWMIDRADLFYVNHTKQIAKELEISSPMVARYKKKIKRLFLQWYYK